MLGSYGLIIGANMAAPANSVKKIMISYIIYVTFIP
jgi:hypothetical protein